MTTTMSPSRAPQTAAGSPARISSASTPRAASATTSSVPCLAPTSAALGSLAPAISVSRQRLGITPTFDKRFGDFNLLAQYSYGRVWYFDEGDVANRPGFVGQDDSRDQSAYVSVGNNESGRKLTGDVFYNWQKSSYDNALPYNYEQLGADLAWQFTPSTALVGQFGGRERPRREYDRRWTRQQLLGRGVALGTGRADVCRGALR